MKRLAAAVALGLAVPAAAARADTLKVPSEAYPSIQSAVDAAGEGDVILVGPGDYEGGVVISGKAQLTIKGKGHPKVQASTSFTISGSSAITVTGMDTGGGLYAFNISGSSNVTVSKCVIAGQIGDAFELANNEGVVISKVVINGGSAQGVLDEGSEDLVIEKCTFNSIVGYVAILSAFGGPGTGCDRAVISKNRSIGTAFGVAVGGNDILIEKNDFHLTSGRGIYVPSETSPVNGVITGNTIVAPNFEGIYVDGDGFEISRNRVTGGGINVPGDDVLVDRNTVVGGPDGILVSGSGATISRNSVTASSGDGIYLGATFDLIEGNRVTAVGGHGISIGIGGGGQIDGNKVSGCDGSGFNLLAGGNVLTGNKSTGNDVMGFYVSSTSNMFLGNKASGNGLYDLADNNAEGVNSYEGDRFGTTVFSYVD